MYLKGMRHMTNALHMPTCTEKNRGNLHDRESDYLSVLNVALSERSRTFFFILHAYTFIWDLNEILVPNSVFIQITFNKTI